MYIPLEKQLAKEARSLYWLSKQSGVSYPTCWRIIHSQVQPKLSTLRKFAEVLRCDLADLIERKASKRESK